MKAPRKLISETKRRLKNNNYREYKEEAQDGRHLKKRMAEAANTAQMMARIVELEKQLEEKTKPKPRQVELKVSYKKCVQINGLRRFPITLYKRELLKILEIAETIKEFIAEHDSELN